MAVKEKPNNSAAIPIAQISVTPDRLAMIAFVSMVFLSAGASIAVRVTYTELPPFWAGASRFTLAAMILWGLVFFRKVELPRGKALTGAILFGVLSVGASFTFIAWGLVETPASLYQIIMALVPLLTILLAFLHRLEALSWQGVLGAFLTVIGIAVAVNRGSGLVFSITHVLAIIVGGACIAEASIMAKMIPRSDPFATTAIAMTIGALMLGTISIITGEQWVIPSQTTTWIAFIYLPVVVTVMVFLLYLWLINRWTASGTSFTFVLMPLVTFILASRISGEQITWGLIAGAALVISGVVFGVLLKPKQRQKPADLTLDCQPC